MNHQERLSKLIILKHRLEGIDDFIMDLQSKREKVIAEFEKVRTEGDTENDQR